MDWTIKDLAEKISNLTGVSCKEIEVIIESFIEISLKKMNLK